jgi:RNA polymerase sigma factor (sigma-70 family)
MPRDPLSEPELLIERVYSYVAYRLGDGPDAEDVTSEVFERAIRYRASFDSGRGSPIQWLLGIARRLVSEARKPVPAASGAVFEQAAPGDLSEDAIRRLAVREALASLDERDRDLLALRYGADLSARQIGEMLEITTHAVEVALSRALARVRRRLEDLSVAADGR